MKAFKKTLALFLATLMTVSAFAAYSVFATTNDGGSEPAPASNEPAAQTEGNTGTATDGWAEETRDGVTAFYIDNLDDFKAFHDNASSNSWYNGKKVLLTADIDMSQASWTWTQVDSFNGTLNGDDHTVNIGAPTTSMFKASTNPTFQNIKFTGKSGSSSANNHAAIIFQPAANTSVTFKNVIMDMEITGTGCVGAFISRPNLGGVTILIENCKNIGTVTGTSYGVGGFVSRNDGATIEIKNSIFAGTIKASSTAIGGGFVGELNSATGSVKIYDSVFSGTVTSSSSSACGGFVGMVGSTNGNVAANVEIQRSVSAGTISGTGAGTGGFVGRICGTATAKLTDCVFTGTISSAGAYSSSMLAYVQANATLDRCVSLGMDPDSGVNGYGALFFALRNVTAAGSITVDDCYAATDTYNAYAKHGTADTNGTLTIKYGGVEANDVKTVATKDGVTLSVSNFHRLCTALVANGWVMTDRTVAYGEELNVPEILPASVATMLGRTVISESPVNAEKWHVKDNGDTLDIRFIGSIKEDEAHLATYDNVGIMIVVKEGDVVLVDKQYNAKAVYTSMYTDVAGVEPIIADEDTYLYTVDMRGFKKDSSYTVEFIAFATYNGVDILDYDGATTITVENGTIA